VRAHLATVFSVQRRIMESRFNTWRGPEVRSSAPFLRSRRASEGLESAMHEIRPGNAWRL